MEIGGSLMNRFMKTQSIFLLAWNILRSQIFSHLFSKGGKIKKRPFGWSKASPFWSLNISKTLDVLMKLKLQGIPAALPKSETPVPHPYTSHKVACMGNIVGWKW